MASYTDTELVEKIKEWYQGDTEINREWVKRAQESFRFYTGMQQWDPQVVGALKASARPALTINRILSTVHMPCGYQRRNRSDLKLYARKGGTVPIAELGTALIKHTMDTSRGEYELSDSFQDGAICGKGWLSLDLDYTNDPLHGDFVIRRESPFDILEDQTNQHYDVNKGMRVFKTWWWDKKEVELTYPRVKTEDLENAMQAPEWGNERVEPEKDWMDYEPHEYTANQMNEGPTDDRLLSKVKYLVKEIWFKEYDRVTFLVHVPTLTLKRIQKDQAEKAAAIIKANDLGDDYRIIDRIAPVMHKVVCVGDMILEKTEDPLDGIIAFPFFRYCPFWANGYAFGLVDNVKEPQEELNKRRSQVLHAANMTINAGMKVGSAANKKAIAELEQMGSHPGKIWDLSKFGGVLEAIDPPKLDAAHFKLAEQAADDIKEISGVNSDLLGTDPRASESGKARMVRQEAGLMVNEVMFDNLDRTQSDLGEHLWERVRRSDVYSEQEILAVVPDATLKHFMVRGADGQPVLDFATGKPAMDFSKIRQWRTGRYGVKVDRGAQSPTMRMAQFETILEARKAGVMIPDEMIFEMGDFPNKERLIEASRQMRQQMQSEQGYRPPRLQGRAG